MRIESQPLGEGLFGQVLIWCAEILPYVDSRGTGGSFVVRSPNYGVPPDFDCLGPFLTELCPDQSAPPEPTYDLVTLKKQHGHEFKGDFARAHALWNKYFAWKPALLDEAQAFTEQHFRGRVLGVHFRGTDKKEGDPVTYQDMDVVLDDYLSRFPVGHFQTLFVTSDEQAYIKHVQARFGHRLNVVYRQDALRSQTRTPVHFAWARRTPGLHPHSVAVDAIVNMLLLARCNAVLKTTSALSAWAKIVNPGLEIWRINGFWFSWFPEAYCPLYQSIQPTTKAILARIQAGEQKHVCS